MSKDNGGPASDRELLEMAAKAAGLHVKGWVGDRMVFFNPITGSAEEHWNPLTDDGDALRLAVRLGLVVDTDYNNGSAVGSAFLDVECCYESDHPMRFGADRNYATRRAIVRAAAAIGSAM